MGFCIADWMATPTEPHQPNEPKTFFINNMTEKSGKQTQLAYHASYQMLTAILAPIFWKFGWKGGAALSRSRAHGQAGVNWNRPENRCQALTTDQKKAFTFSPALSKIAPLMIRSGGL